MWINVDGVAVYVDLFQENGWQLKKDRIGWDLFDPSMTKQEEFLTYEEFISSELLRSQMPKTHAIIKQELTKHDNN
jgi:hypothetical protein